jgi:hypothetical protein
MILAARSPGDIVTGPGRTASLVAPAGIPAAELAPAQRDVLLALVEEYARNMRADVADEELHRIHAAGFERLHFGWAGPIEPGHAHYYRIHGPTVLIEFDNSQNEANHIHSVWHDPRNAFGADLLRAHYEDGHHRHHARAGAPLRRGSRADVL